MSVQNIEKFYAIAAADDAVFAQLVDGVETRGQFVGRAVDVADQHGLSFTADEADRWISEQERIHASGELNDTQLESVAGGKSKKDKRQAQMAAPGLLGFLNPAIGAVYIGGIAGAAIGSAVKNS